MSINIHSCLLDSFSRMNSMSLDVQNLSPGDPKLIETIVNHFKSQGIFDQFRKDCLADVDTKPAYQNLRQRVDGNASKFLNNMQWRADLNKNQLRDSVRKQIHDSGMLNMGVDRIVDQVVNSKIYQVFMPKISSVVHQFLGIKEEIMEFIPPPTTKSEDLNKTRDSLGTDTELTRTPSPKGNSSLISESPRSELNTSSDAISVTPSHADVALASEKSVSNVTTPHCNFASNPEAAIQEMNEDMIKLEIKKALEALMETSAAVKGEEGTLRGKLNRTLSSEGIGSKKPEGNLWDAIKLVSESETKEVKVEPSKKDDEVEKIKPAEGAAKQKSNAAQKPKTEVVAKSKTESTTKSAEGAAAPRLKSDMVKKTDAVKLKSDKVMKKPKTAEGKDGKGKISELVPKLKEQPEKTKTEKLSQKSKAKAGTDVPKKKDVKPKDLKSKYEKDSKSKDEKDLKSKDEKDLKSKDEKDSKSKDEKDSKSKDEKDLTSKDEKDSKSKDEKDSKSKDEKDSKSKDEKDSKSKDEKDSKSKDEKDSKSKDEKDSKSKDEKDSKSKDVKDEKASKLTEEKDAKPKDVKPKRDKDLKTVEEVDLKGKDGKEKEDKSVKHKEEKHTKSSEKAQKVSKAVSDAGKSKDEKKQGNTNKHILKMKPDAGDGKNVVQKVLKVGTKKSTEEVKPPPAKDSKLKNPAAKIPEKSKIPKPEGVKAAEKPSVVKQEEAVKVTEKQKAVKPEDSGKVMEKLRKVEEKPKVEEKAKVERRDSKEKASVKADIEKRNFYEKVRVESTTAKETSPACEGTSPDIDGSSRAGDATLKRKRSSELSMSRKSSRDTDSSLGFASGVREYSDGGYSGNESRWFQAMDSADEEISKVSRKKRRIKNAESSEDEEDKGNEKERESEKLEEGGGGEDDNSADALSDVTVSSVHTSDLSDFDDHISLTDAEEEKAERGSDAGNNGEGMPKKRGRGRPRKRRYSGDRQNDDKLCDKKSPEKSWSESGPRRELRRQRRLNPKYASDDFSSIFNRQKGKGIFHGETEDRESNSTQYAMIVPNVMIPMMSSVEIERVQRDGSSFQEDRKRAPPGRVNSPTEFGEMNRRRCSESLESERKSRSSSVSGSPAAKRLRCGSLTDGGNESTGSQKESGNKAQKLRATKGNVPRKKAT